MAVTNHVPGKRGFGVDSVLLWHVKQNHGIEGKEFIDYVRRSVKASHTKGNRRFHDWFFVLNEKQTVVAYCYGEQGEVITARSIRLAKQGLTDDPPPPLIPKPKTPLKLPEAPSKGATHFQNKPHTYYHCEVCQDTGKVKVYDECPYCEGSGCEHCGNQGEIPTKIPCQSCSTDPKGGLRKRQRN